MDRFILCEVDYPEEKTEVHLLEKSYPALPESIRTKMVEYATEVRKLFMGSNEGSQLNRIEVTFSTRTLLRWADLTLRFQPLANQGIQPVSYALDRALGFRASGESRAVLHELFQRIFPTENEKKTKPA